MSDTIDDDIPLLKIDQADLFRKEENDLTQREELENTNRTDNACYSDSNAWKQADSRRKYLLGYMIISNFLLSLCTASSQPFFSRIIRTKHGSTAIATAILNITKFTTVLSNVTSGKIQSSLGCELLHVFGIICFGLGQIGFAMTALIESYDGIVITGLIVRGVQGVGQGAFLVSLLCILCQEFPGHLGFVIFIQEVAIAVGLTFAPSIGGVLYDGIGQVAAQLIPGIMWLLVCSSWICIRRISSTYEAISIGGNQSFGLLRKPKAILLTGMLATVYGSLGAFETTITVYLADHRISVGLGGLIMLIFGLPHFTTYLYLGHVTSRNRHIRNSLLVLGFSGCLCICLIFTKDRQLWYICIGLFLYGMTSSFALVTGFEILELVCGGCQTSSDVKHAQHSSIGGVWHIFFAASFYCLGFIGSALQKITTFNYALLILMMAGYSLSGIFAALIFVVQLLQKPCG